MALIRSFVNKFTGLLIGIEGADGSGKTIFSQTLAKVLAENGCETVLTKEPGGTKFGVKIREILQYMSDPLTAKSEYLLFAADRAQHFVELVIPSLQSGKIVLSDRTGDSSIVYQGYGRGLDVDMIKNVNKWAMCDIAPDLIIYLKIDAQTANNRVHKRAEDLTRFELEHEEFINKTIHGFDKLYANQENVLTLDGRLAVVDLVESAAGKILDIVKRKKIK
jgi:dTMP kinase